MEKKSKSWGAEGVEAGATVVEVSAPVGAVGALDVVAVSVLRQGLDAVDGAEAVFGVHYLEVAEVAGLAEAVAGEVAGTHLGGGVAAVASSVHHLSAPFHHGGMLRQVCEQLCRPIPYQRVVAETHPPISHFWVL